MYVLGIETSCDETSVSVVKAGKRILSCPVASSLHLHKKYGGVIPEIASRKQLETIVAVADAALHDAGVSLKQIRLIAVTAGPGLLGSLLTGIAFAKSISMATGIPLIGVNHIYSHIYANFLDSKGVQLPFVALVVSGGHTSLFCVRDFDRIEVLGETLDDACGEAFDKVAKILGLGYPGGPLIERLAREGEPRKYPFRCCQTNAAYDFSFSGIKTAVLYLVRGKNVTARVQRDVAASFQESVVNALIAKSLSACRDMRINRLVVGGGVAANGVLRDKFYEAGARKRVRVFFPPKFLCMDNAAMVAGLASRLYHKGYRSDQTISANIS